MQIIEWQQFLDNGLRQEEKLASMTIGIFDGVHRGHRALIERVVSHVSLRSADEKKFIADAAETRIVHNDGFLPVIITFRENHKTKDKKQITGGGGQSDIQTFQQRLSMFEKLGIQITVVIDYTEEFRRMHWIDFLNVLLKHSCVGFFAVGSDFRCGYKLDTDAEAIKKFFTSRNIPAEIVPQVMEGGLPVSSSRIRCAIASGDLSLAESMLGYACK